MVEAIKALGTFKHLTPAQNLKDSWDVLKNSFTSEDSWRSGFSTFQWLLVLYPKTGSCYWGLGLQTPENRCERLKHVKWLLARRLTAGMIYKTQFLYKIYDAAEFLCWRNSKGYVEQIEIWQEGRDYSMQWMTAGRCPCQKFTCNMWYQ